MNVIDQRYILKVGEPASFRLDLLDALHGKYSEQFLNEIQIKDSVSILDIGCGVGNMSCWFAKKFPYAHVVGLDNSSAQLDLAKKRANQKKLMNIRFCFGDLNQVDNQYEQFDIIYSRYSLIHVNNPVETLKNLKNKLAPDGRFVLEEPTMSSAFCYPDNLDYQKSRVLLNRLAELRGFDFEIGKKLETMLHDLGLTIQHRHLVQPLLETFDEKQLLLLLVEECRDSYLSHDLISEDALEEMILNLEKLIQMKGTCIGFPRTTQVCAVKMLG